MNTWAWPVNRDPYYIAFSGFVGGPIGRMLIRRYNFFANSIMRQAFGDKRKLSAAAHEQYLRPLAAPEDRTGCYVFPKQIVASTPWLGRLWDKIPTLSGKPMLDCLGHERHCVQRERTEALGAHVPCCTVDSPACGGPLCPRGGPR